MSLVDVDRMESEQVTQAKIKKETEAKEKKMRNKAQLKIAKEGIRKPRAKPVTRQPEAPPEYKPVEWAKTAMDFGFSALALPGGNDRKEFEKRLRQSQDMQQMMANMPLTYIYENAPTEVLYGLTYLSILAETKLASGHKPIQNIQPDKPQPTSSTVVDIDNDDDGFSQVVKK